MYKIYTTISLLIISVILPASILAQDDRHATQGEIELESYELSGDSVVDKRKKTVEYIKSIDQVLKQAALGNVTNPAPMKSLEKGMPGLFSTAALTQISVGYLRCSIFEGTCLPVLDFLFESDLISSKLDNKASCPNLQRFWKVWIENDMEKRHQHQVQIGFIKDTEIFNKETRPSYIKCKDAISALIADTKITPAEFFKERYLQNPKKLDSAMATAKILETLEQNNPSAFDLSK